MNEARRPYPAVATLAVILVITAAWWTLALWPPTVDGPAWIERTRLACFGASPGGLPNAGGWMVMTGQPLGMLGILFVVWGKDVVEGLRGLQRLATGQLVIGAALAGIVAGLAAVALRVSSADARPFDVNTTTRLASQLTRISDTVPTMRLADQTGRVLDLAELRGKTVLVTFAYAHCETVCPLVVMDLLDVQDRIRRDVFGFSPVTDSAALAAALPEIVIVTLDPLRDTPSRLPSIVEQWKLGLNAHVLSGPVEEVERALNAWRVPRVRNSSTGDYSHPTMVYVIGPDGRITYVTTGGADIIAAAVKAI